MKGSLFIIPALGVLAIAHFLLKYARKKIRQIRDEAALPSKADLIPALSGVDLNSLAVLSQSSDINLRRCAEQFIVERFTSRKEYLEALFTECLNGDTLKGCTVLITILSNGYWPVGFDTVTMVTMAKVLMQHSPKETSTKQLRIDQLATEGLFTSYAMEYNPSEKLKMLVREVPGIAFHLIDRLEVSRDKDILRFSLLMVHEFISLEETEKYIVISDGVKILSQVFNSQQGDSNMQNLCLQCLIELASKYPIEPVIFDMHRQLIACLRTTDENENKLLIKHALMMLSKLKVENLCKIAEIPGIVGAFSRNLSGPLDLQQQVLQLLFNIACDSVTFKQQILNCHDIINVLPVLYQSSDKEVCSYSLALTHCLLYDAESSVALKLVNSNDKIVSSLSSLTNLRGELAIHGMVVGILAVFCCSEEAILKVMKHAKAIPAIIYFVKLYSSDKDIKTNGTGMLLNLAMTSDANKKAILEAGGLSALLDVAWEDNEMELSTMAAKTLIILAHSGFSTQMKVEFASDYGTLSVAGNRVIVTEPKFDVIRWKLSTNKLKHVLHAVKMSDLDEFIIPTGPTFYSGGIVYVFIATGQKPKSILSELFNREFKESLIFENDEGISSIDEIVSVNGNCILIGVIQGGALYIKHHQISTDNEINLEYNIDLDDLVQRITLEKLTSPMISILIESPVNASISKITELELLEVFAHQKLHAQAFMITNGWFGHIRYMILHVSDGLDKQQEIEPLGYLHCLAAVKLLAILAVPHDAVVLNFHEFLPLLLSLQNAITNLWIKDMIDTSTDLQKHVIKKYNEILQNIARVSLLVIYRACHSTKMLNSIQTVYSSWSLLLSSGNISSWFEVVCGYILNTLSCCDNKEVINSDAGVCCTFSESDSTPSIQLSANKLQVRNDDDRTFESIRTTHSVSATDDIMQFYAGWYYEVTLNSSGIIQLGWATADCKFTPLKGLGVGDDEHSVAYDGYRAKKWNGALTSNQAVNDYGEKWNKGAVIGCLLTKTGDVSYTQNGIPLGIAFQDIDMNKKWFPAVSLSTDQQVTFNFGAAEFSFQPPADYISIYKYAVNSSEEIESNVKPKSEPKEDLENYVNQSEINHPVPSLYYEIQLDQPSKQTLEFGYITGNKSVKKTCLLNGYTLELPDNKQVNVRYPLCIGLGYLLYETAFLITMNGNVVDMKFPITLTSQVHLLPYFNDSRLNVNYGSKSFKYSVCNDKKYNLTAGALLMDYFTLSTTQT
ncbi:uncharacterized protein LOC141911653 [Tubulanus polymorphus]|uniref:uncharacterized protein LOC141911653 n=1 Tax=Tubulanus polymorphus TaxID=672921 RepID=UPI003DA56B80